MTNRIGKITTAAVVAVATAAMGLGALVAPTAFAAAPAPGNIDPNATGSLIIHKREKTTGNGSATGDGTEDTTVTGKGLKNVTFTVTPVLGIDLKTAADWNDLGNLDHTKVSGTNVTISSTKHGTLDTNTSHIKTGTTDDNGDVTIDDLPVGLYYVQETGIGDNAITAKAQPFFVTIPYPAKNSNSTNPDWLYHVHVYPKNTLGTTTKDVDVNGVRSIGDPVTWNIDQNVPGLETGQSHSAFGFHDLLDEHLSFDSSDASNLVVTGRDSDGNDSHTFHEPADYTVTTTTEGSRQHVFVEFTRAGLDQLSSYSSVRFALKTTISSMPDSGKIPNYVWPLINDYDPWNQQTTHENPPVPSENDPFYGDFTINKVDDSTPGKALAGATFQLWRKGSAAACTVPTDTNQILTATSGSDGQVKFSGVFIKKAPQRTDPSTVSDVFCYRESAASAGYVLNDQIKQITLNAGKTTNDPITVTNTKQHGPNLPLTGAAGAVVLTVAAVALIALAGGLYVVNRRRQSTR